VPAIDVAVRGHHINQQRPPFFQGLGKIRAAHHLDLTESFSEHDHLAAGEAVLLDDALRIRTRGGIAPFALANQFCRPCRRHPVGQPRRIGQGKDGAILIAGLFAGARETGARALACCAGKAPILAAGQKVIPRLNDLRAGGGIAIRIETVQSFIQPDLFVRTPSQLPGQGVHAFDDACFMGGYRHVDSIRQVVQIVTQGLHLGVELRLFGQTVLMLTGAFRHIGAALIEGVPFLYQDQLALGQRLALADERLSNILGQGQWNLWLGWHAGVRQGGGEQNGRQKK
jgi:hypothetical protein